MAGGHVDFGEDRLVFARLLDLRFVDGVAADVVRLLLVEIVGEAKGPMAVLVDDVHIEIELAGGRRKGSAAAMIQRHWHGWSGD